MTTVWLVLMSPYAYDRAMKKAEKVAKRQETPLRVVFFIEQNAVSGMVEDLSEMGWLGPGSLRTLQNSMSQGYRALADDVLERVRRKVEQVEVILEGVVEKPSLVDYLNRLSKTENVKIILGAAELPTVNVDDLPKTVQWIVDK
ncbi:hypothetical protein [Lusitaniella coriacea]|uniref:hypothetical protein n=1 Tax=Lusitaniella coriacea TaxID=1983105 RepID=UPI003CE858B9